MPNDHKSNRPVGARKAVHSASAGRWGKRYLTEEMLAVRYLDEPINHDDPNYDSMEEESSIPFSMDMPVTKEAETPRITFKEFQIKVKAIVEEFFANKNVEDAVACVEQLQCRPYHDELVVIAVRISLDRGAFERSLVEDFLDLLSDEDLLSSAEVLRGFEKLVIMSEDLQLDVPKAPVLILEFIEHRINSGLVSSDVMYRLPEEMLTRLLCTVDKSEQYSDLAPTLVQQRRSLQRFKQSVQASIEEYLSAESVDEVANELRDLAMPQYHHELVRKAVTVSMDRSNRDRELVSRLLCRLNIMGNLKYEDLIVGFTRLLSQIEDDLELDCPEAGDILAKYVARALTDECLPPAFLTNSLRLRIGKQAGRRVLEKVEGMIQDPLALEQSFKIWGSPADELNLLSEAIEQTAFKEEIKNTIHEYFDSRDVEEVARILLEMCLLPYQKAELVRKLAMFAMERSDEEMQLALNLMDYLESTEVLAGEDLMAGFDQLFEKMPDIKLDIPDCQELAYKFIERIQDRGLIHASYAPKTA